MTMEELLASQTKKLTTLFRGQEVEGEIAALKDKEIILDLGAKSEGVLPAGDVPSDQLSSLKVGDKIKAFVVLPENENGQVLLSFERQSASVREGRGRLRGGRVIDWPKFIQARKQKSKLQGKVMEVNKGGLIVESSGTRGFLPNSQVGFELLGKSEDGMENLIGQDLTVTVIEVDPNNNKLIFSERGQISEEAKQQLKQFQAGRKVSGKIVAILPFGLVVNVAGTEGLVFISDVSWERVEDLSKMFEVGQEIEVLVLGLDEELGRLNLSIKALTEDPFVRLAGKYPADEVARGEITQVTAAGVVVSLDGIEGYLPAAKMNPDITYEAGKSMSFLVDSVDTGRRRVNLASFVTSTARLIYK